MKFLWFLIIFLISFSCNKKDVTENVIDKAESARINQDEKTIRTIDDSIKILNDRIVKSIKSADFEAFSKFIHPDKGIRFSMYAHVDTLKDKHFPKTDFLKYADTPTKFTWGTKDGTGEPLVMSIKDYFSEWIFKNDFTTSNYSFNTFQAEGNSLNNLKEAYPNAYFTENFFKGSEKYNEMDWKTLRLVFEKKGGHYYLTAVINDEWTI